MASELHAPVLWAQRQDTVYLSINLQDVKNEKIQLEPTKLTFTGTSNGKNYVANVQFFKEIDPEKSKYVVRPRSIEFILQKKEKGPYWDQLLKEKGKYNWLKVDWDKWKDEDEVDEEDAFDMSGMSNFDFGNQGGFDMGGGEEDSDEEEIPGLETASKEEEEENKKQETQ